MLCTASIKLTFAKFSQQLGNDKDAEQAFKRALQVPFRLISLVHCALQMIRRILENSLFFVGKFVSIVSFCGEFGELVRIDCVCWRILANL